MAKEPKSNQQDADEAQDGLMESNEVDPELTHAVSLVASLSTNESMPDDIEAIICRDMTADDRGLLDRMKDTANSLGMYLGDRPTATWLLIAISQGHGDMDGVDLLGDIRDDAARIRVETMLRRLGGLYGETIGRGLNVATRPAEDWQYVNTSTRFEVEQAQWLITLEVDRFDGERLRISGDGVSVIRLVNHMLAAINSIGSLAEDYPAILYDHEEILTFTSEARAILEGLDHFDDEDEGLDHFDDEEEAPTS